MESPAISTTARQPRYRRVADRILADFTAGPGHPLPGERELADRYGVSRGTVIAALNQLEQEHRVERLPARGTFLATGGGHAVLRVVLPFPAPGISSGGLQAENCAIVQEIQRGLIDAALVADDAITFQYFPDVEDGISLSGQVQRLATYDAAVFIGRQLGRLRDLFAATGRPCVQIAGNEDPNARVAGVSHVDYDLDAAFDMMLGHLAGRGYRRVAVLLRHLDRASEREKFEVFAASARRCGLACDRELVHDLGDEPPSATGEALARRFQGGLPAGEVLYCMDTGSVEPLWRQLVRGRIPAPGLAYFASASGLTFQYLDPQPTHIRLPFYQLGRMAHAAAVTALRTGASVQTVIGAELVTGTTA